MYFTGYIQVWTLNNERLKHDFEDSYCLYYDAVLNSLKPFFFSWSERCANSVPNFGTERKIILLVPNLAKSVLSGFSKCHSNCKTFREVLSGFSIT